MQHSSSTMNSRKIEMLSTGSCLLKVLITKANKQRRNRIVGIRIPEGASKFDSTSNLASSVLPHNYAQSEFRSNLNIPLNLPLQLFAFFGPLFHIALIHSVRLGQSMYFETLLSFFISLPQMYRHLLPGTGADRSQSRYRWGQRNFSPVIFKNSKMLFSSASFLLTWNLVSAVVHSFNELSPMGKHVCLLLNKFF